jgi:PTH1 family peptidyl-tRNA hydrolase
MNSSGLAARNLVRRAGIRPERLIVIYDDFDLPLGEIRIRKEGSAGSHRGMGSIIEELGTSRIPRIRIGIGPLPTAADPVDFVLSPFTSEERERLAAPLERATDALEMILTGEIDAAMSRFN